MALFDVSVSVPMDVRERYMGDFKRFANYCARRDARMHADLIGSDTLGNNIPPLVSDLRPDQPRDNELFDNAQRFRKIEEMVEEISLYVLDDRLRTNGTDIFGGLIVAARRFSGSVGERHLVIFSDGLQSADPFNITKRDLSDPAVVNRIFVDTGSAGLRANLQMATVDMVGVESSEAITPLRQALALERFWKGYIERVQGRLNQYNKSWSAPR